MTPNPQTRSARTVATACGAQHEDPGERADEDDRVEVPQHAVDRAGDELARAEGQVGAAGDRPSPLARAHGNRPRVHVHEPIDCAFPDQDLRREPGWFAPGGVRENPRAAVARSLLP
ncbi:hypothetical protein GCM10009755_07930 [Brevibacterium samyangense]|uniref:Uncharacterized protein n=1 Tax=Brevibacterium samyangense TaxID=366888 RepID=A0ABP5ELP5_9MICO